MTTFCVYRKQSSYTLAIGKSYDYLNNGSQEPNTTLIDLKTRKILMDKLTLDVWSYQDWGTFKRPKDCPRWVQDALVEILAPYYGGPDEVKAVIRLYQVEDLSRPHLIDYGSTDDGWHVGSDGHVMLAVRSFALDPKPDSMIAKYYQDMLVPGLREVQDWVTVKVEDLREAIKAAQKAVSKKDCFIVRLDDGGLTAIVSGAKNLYHVDDWHIVGYKVEGSKLINPMGWVDGKLLLEALDGLEGGIKLGFTSLWAMVLDAGDQQAMVMGMAVSGDLQRFCDGES